MTTRVSQVIADGGRQMWTPVKRNDAGVVIRLRDDHSVSRSLDDLSLGRNARRAIIRSGIAAPEHGPCVIPRDATRVQVSERLHADLRVSGLTCGSSVGLSLLCLRRQGGKLAILRVHDQ